MKRIAFFAVLAALLVALVIFRNNNAEDAVVEKEAPEGRNMFGNGLERGLVKNTDEATPGYVMLTVQKSASTYLMDRDGNIVHEWKSNYGIHGGYLMNDGTLYVDANDVDFPVFAGGGECGRLQKLSWDSKILWDFEYANEEHHHHHDFAVMPNGNVLAIAWESISPEECLALGRKPELIPEAGLWPDKIVEIKPQGKHGGEVVWEWHAWDHVVQNYDKSLPNYGDPSEYPGRIDINLCSNPLPEPITQDSMDRLHAMGREWRNRTVENRGSDLYHFNAVNYNAKLDQIAISSPKLNEIFIIDHSTTTDQAAGSTGGRWGRGGDLLYRWGNPENYGRGDTTDRVLGGQHDVRWIEEGKPGAGNLTIFNNNQNLDPDTLNYSSVLEIKPPTDSVGNYILSENGVFGPEEPEWKYIADDTLSFWSSFVSGAHRLSNGHTFVNQGAMGRLFEITADGEIVWDYLNQHEGNIRKPNGDPFPPSPFAMLQFRATLIPTSHPALAGKELEPIDPQPEPYKPQPRPEE